MDVKTAAATKVGYVPTETELILFPGLNAGICYMPDNYETLRSEDVAKTIKRAEGTLKSGHHSVYDHTFVTLTLVEIPKILAMVLNNEKIYTTSEKSARYTVMATGGKECELYEKWTKTLTAEIQRRLPELKPREAEKLALENARYFISVFTPATTMSYTVSIRQLNYMLGWIENWLEAGPKTEFEYRLLPILEEFYWHVCAEGLNIPGLRDGKGRGFSLFAPRERATEWGENYCTTYSASLTYFAQAQRHRTIYYEMAMPDAVTVLDELSGCQPVAARGYFYTPLVLEHELAEKWSADMVSVAYDYPQGMLLEINERGTFENFLLKCKERLCGQAQFEIWQKTARTLREYYHGIGGWPFISDPPEGEPTDSPLWQELNQYIWNGDDRRCKMGVKCDRPCIWVRNDGSLGKRFV